MESAIKMTVRLVFRTVMSPFYIGYLLFSSVVWLHHWCNDIEYTVDDPATPREVIRNWLGV